MLASNTLLSNLGIAYGNLPNGQGQKAINDFAGALLMAYDALGNPNPYKSPANLPLPATIGLVLTPDQIAAGLTEADAIRTLAASDVSQFTPPVVAAQTAAVYAYHDVTTSGDLSKIHTAIDAINALAPLTKQPLIDGYPDLTYLRCAAGVIGLVAQMCGDGAELFTYGQDPVTDKIIADARAASGPATMQPTVFFQ